MRPKEKLAIAALAASFFLLLAGCASQPQSNAQDTIPTASLANLTNSMNASTAFAPPKVTNTCWTGALPCPDGSSVRGTWCTSGFSSVPACNTSYLGNTAGIPDRLLPLAKFKCYWDLRRTYGFGNYFTPAEICAAKIAGWGESCKCAEFIEKYDLATGNS